MNNKVGVPAIDKMAHITNGAPNTKQTIIGIASFDEILHKELEKYKRMQEKEEKQKEEVLNFNPKEIQTLVYRNNHDEMEK